MDAVISKITSVTPLAMNQGEEHTIPANASRCAVNIALHGGNGTCDILLLLDSSTSGQVLGHMNGVYSTPIAFDSAVVGDLTTRRMVVQCQSAQGDKAYVGVIETFKVISGGD